MNVSIGCNQNEFQIPCTKIPPGHFQPQHHIDGDSHNHHGCHYIVMQRLTSTWLALWATLGCTGYNITVGTVVFFADEEIGLERKPPQLVCRSCNFKSTRRRPDFYPRCLRELVYPAGTGLAVAGFPDPAGQLIARCFFARFQPAVCA